MNVGISFHVDEELDAIIDAASGGVTADEIQSNIDQLEQRLSEIDENHPLRVYLNSALIQTFRGLAPPHEAAQYHLDSVITQKLPSFLRAAPEIVEDSMQLGQGKWNAAEQTGLRSFIQEVSLDPHSAISAEPTERVRVFNERSDTLSAALSEIWVHEIKAEFVPFKQDRELGLAIESQGSLDPPSRRSHGFNAYLGLAAALFGLRRDTNKDFVLLLDDPALHLHPLAQEKLGLLLGAQPFPIIAATHLPFMIKPDALDRVRLIRRTRTGSVLEHDWAKAGSGLLPLAATLSPWTVGRIPVLAARPRNTVGECLGV